MGDKHVAALKFAREKIASRQNEFICNALSQAEVCYPEEVAELGHWVREAIAPHDTLNGWVHEVVGVIPTLDQMLEYRLRWLDHLMEVWQ